MNELMLEQKETNPNFYVRKNGGKITLYTSEQLSFEIKDLNMFLCLMPRYLDYRIKFANEVKSIIKAVKSGYNFVKNDIQLFSSRVDIDLLGLDIRNIDKVIDSIFRACIQEEKISPHFNNHILLDYLPIKLRHLLDSAKEYQIKASKPQSNLSNPEGGEMLISKRGNAPDIYITFDINYIDSLIRNIEFVLNLNKIKLDIAKQLTNK